MTNEYLGQQRPHIVLEDSDHTTWGMVKDMSEIPTYGEEGLNQAPIVGQWSKSPSDGMYHVSLMKSVDVLCDERTMRWAERAASREGRKLPESKVTIIEKSRVKYTPKQDIQLDPETKQFRMV